MKTKIQFFAQTICSLVLASVIGACGATSHQVVNKPPAINLTAKPYAVEYGSIAVQSITLFYWPDESEEELAVAARTIQLSAFRLDAVAKKKIEFAMLAGGFAKLECLQNFATAIQEQPGSPLPWVTGWKTLPDMPVVTPVPEGDPNYESYQAYLKYLVAQKGLAYCQDNQAKRMPLFQWLATVGQQEAKEANADIANAVDPKGTGENFLSASAEGTVIQIAATSSGPKVDVTIKDFLMKGYSPTTAVTKTPNGEIPATIAGAVFLPDRRLLAFGVAEFSPLGKLTGRHFEIKMERGPDFMGMARFSGELSLMQGKTVLRIGSISITGILTPDSN